LVGLCYDFDELEWIVIEGLFLVFGIGYAVVVLFVVGVVVIVGVWWFVG